MPGSCCITLLLLAGICSPTPAWGRGSSPPSLESSLQEPGGSGSSGSNPTPSLSPDDFVNGVKFELYTRENPDDPEYIRIFDESTRRPRLFQHKRPTKIGIHGWLADMMGMRDLRLAFLAKEDVNFILVNWTAVDSVLYPWSRGKVPGVAKRLSALLDFLQLNDVHLIGHSLGAHIAGMAGAEGHQVARITGLDPAGPLFEGDPGQRLDPSDAAFVDVIHTCGNVMGYSEPIGHVDFYPNGGKCSQPGCMMADLTTGSCSHDRSYDYFRESLLNASSFTAWQCAGYGDTSWQQPGERPTVTMGIACPPTARGTFCLNTRAAPPFGMGDLMVAHSNAVRHVHEHAALSSLVRAAIRRRFLRGWGQGQAWHFS